MQAPCFVLFLAFATLYTCSGQDCDGFYNVATGMCYFLTDDTWDYVDIDQACGEGAEPAHCPLNEIYCFNLSPGAFVSAFVAQSSDPAVACPLYVTTTHMQSACGGHVIVTCQRAVESDPGPVDTRGKCVAKGDPFVMTPDDALIAVIGTGDYLLMQPQVLADIVKSWDVVVRVTPATNAPFPGMTSITAVVVDVGNMQILINMDMVMVGTDVYTHATQAVGLVFLQDDTFDAYGDLAQPGFNVTREDQDSFQVHSPTVGISVHFSMNEEAAKVITYVDQIYANQTMGLCGDFNGNSVDDYRTVYSNQDVYNNKSRYALISESARFDI